MQIKIIITMIQSKIKINNFKINNSSLNNKINNLIQTVNLIFNHKIKEIMEVTKINLNLDKITINKRGIRCYK